MFIQLVVGEQIYHIRVFSIFAVDFFDFRNYSSVALFQNERKMFFETTSFYEESFERATLVAFIEEKPVWRVDMGDLWCIDCDGRILFCAFFKS